MNHGEHGEHGGHGEGVMKDAEHVGDVLGRLADRYPALRGIVDAPVSEAAKAAPEPEVRPVQLEMGIGPVMSKRRRWASARRGKVVA